MFAVVKPKRKRFRIKAVIFDLGNVLLNYDIRKAARSFSQDYKIPPLKIWFHFLTSPAEKAYTCGKMSCRKFYLSARKALKMRISFATFRKYWNDIFWENADDGGIEELIVRLKKRYPLYLISNTNKMHFEHIKRQYKILGHFRKTFPSHEMGCRKPDLEIYQRVLETIKLEPEETVFIDDVPQFVRAAKRVGMNGIQYRNKKQLIRDLRRLGVQVPR